MRLSCSLALTLALLSACATSTEGTPATVEPAAAEGDLDGDCTDGIDNDGDGRTDCEQNTCWRNWDATDCVEETEDECSDGVNNDDDVNGADCDDPDCGFSLACGGSGTPEATNETCSDGEDNDGDTYTDCDDWSCQYTTSVTVCD